MLALSKELDTERAIVTCRTKIVFTFLMFLYNYVLKSLYTIATVFICIIAEYILQWQSRLPSNQELSIKPLLKVSIIDRKLDMSGKWKL